jgi:RNA polymerase sigma-70 factor, ECF subfamily
LALRQDELTSLCDDVDLDRDRALVERCQSGDSAAFGNLYARYYERLLRFCLRRLNDRHEAEDAAQEAFARAWKALPRFAGERRFYPWLTVIAGNICTDMLRRRSRSTPTDDMELTAQHPVGVVGADTSEELVLAAVDGELVNRALDRLSTRHRHVLAMREGSGWTYQQIADHEGVEIGTIETLLWRARQALKREFAVVSESKEALAGFLVATGALIRRTAFRAAHRTASMTSSSGGGTGGGGGGLRNAFAGFAVTGAAVAAAFIAPHALSGPPSAPLSSAGASIADPGNALGVPVPPATTTTTTPSTPAASTDSGGSGSSDDQSAGGTATGGGASGGGPSSPTSLLGGLTAGAAPVTNGLNQATTGLNGTVNGVTNGLNNTVNGLTNGLNNTLNGLSTGLENTTQNLTNGLNNTLNGVGGLLGGAAGAPAASGSDTSNTPTTTTTTEPGGLLGGLGDVVSGLLGGK